MGTFVACWELYRFAGDFFPCFDEEIGIASCIDLSCLFSEKWYHIRKGKREDGAVAKDDSVWGCYSCCNNGNNGSNTRTQNQKCVHAFIEMTFAFYSWRCSCLFVSFNWSWFHFLFLCDAARRLFDFFFSFTFPKSFLGRMPGLKGSQNENFSLTGQGDLCSNSLVQPGEMFVKQKSKKGICMHLSTFLFVCCIHIITLRILLNLLKWESWNKQEELDLISLTVRCRFKKEK